jgi:hypothetical protein
MATAARREPTTTPATVTGELLVARALKAEGPACVNVLIDPNVYSSGTMTQTMYK